MRIFLPFLLISLFFNAQSIETDRPDQTESTSLVPKNFIQIEAGFLYEKNNSELVQNPLILWKYGLTNFLELRVQTDYEIIKNPEEKLSGYSPLIIGFKGKITEENKILPAISALSHFSYGKWASKAYQSNQWSYDFRLLFNHTLSEKFTLGYNVGGEWDFDGEELKKLYTLSLSYAVDDKFACFFETYGFYNSMDRADNRLDFGFTYLVSKNFQLDASSGLGLSATSPDYFISAGISYRFNVSK